MSCGIGVYCLIGFYTHVNSCSVEVLAFSLPLNVPQVLLCKNELRLSLLGPYGKSEQFILEICHESSAHDVTGASFCLNGWGLATLIKTTHIELVLSLCVVNETRAIICTVQEKFQMLRTISFRKRFHSCLFHYTQCKRELFFVRYCTLLLYNGC